MCQKTGHLHTYLLLASCFKPSLEQQIPMLSHNFPCLALRTNVHMLVVIATPWHQWLFEPDKLQLVQCLLPHVLPHTTARTLEYQLRYISWHCIKLNTNCRKLQLVFGRQNGWIINTCKQIVKASHPNIRQVLQPIQVIPSRARGLVLFEPAEPAPRGRKLTDFMLLPYVPFVLGMRASSGGHRLQASIMLHLRFQNHRRGFG